MARSTIAAVLLALLLTANPAAAADSFDGSANLICSVTKVVGCVDGSQCLQGTARTFDLPTLMAIAFDEKVVRQARESGDDSVSPIKNIEVTGTQLVLQGVENGHGWVMAIHRENGQMSVGAIGEDLSFSMFGFCTAP